MKWFLIAVMWMALNMVAPAQMPKAKQVTDVEVDGDVGGVEFTTDGSGSIRFDLVRFKPNADGDGFDASTYYDVLALTPKGHFLQHSKNQHTEVDYVSGVNLGMGAHTAVFSLEHGWLYAKRMHNRAPAPPSPPDGSEGSDDPMQVDPVEMMFIGPHWPIVIIRDIGAGAEGTEMLVVRRRDWDDPTVEYAYVLMMEGGESSYVWALNLDEGDDELPVENRVMVDEMNDMYLLVRFDDANAAGIVQRRHLHQEPHKERFDEEAKLVRELVIERRQRNKDKFWNPGMESY